MLPAWEVAALAVHLPPESATKRALAVQAAAPVVEQERPHHRPRTRMSARDFGGFMTKARKGVAT